MSTVIEAMANALIEFILSLLRDPDAAEEFTEDPDAALASRGLDGMTYEDLCAVLPLVYDHPQIVQRGEPSAANVVAPPPVVIHNDVLPSQVIRELQEVINNNAYITNNATILDQSVNQNLWSQGDILQLFDNQAIIASGAGSTAAGGHIVDDSSTDSSTTITTGRDAVVDSAVSVDTTTGSHNTHAPTSDSSTTTTVSGSSGTVTVTPAPTAAPEPAPEPAPAPAPAPAAAEPAPATAPAAAPAPAPEPAAADPAPVATSEPEPYEEPAGATLPEDTYVDEPTTEAEF